MRGAIHKGGGIDYAQERIQHYSDAAIATLESFPDSEYKSALINVVHFNAQRSS
ncbi:hypothetical protein ES703_16721 [subsurface metagenome]